MKELLRNLFHKFPIRGNIIYKQSEINIYFKPFYYRLTYVPFDFAVTQHKYIDTRDTIVINDGIVNGKYGGTKLFCKSWTTCLYPFNFFNQ